MILVSIIIPAYNVNKYIADTCCSVHAQTLQNWECIIVDDGSTDDTAAIAERFCAHDPRFRLVRQNNTGVSAARTAGMRQAMGEFIVFLDADDLLEKDALELWVDALQRRHDCVLAWGGVVRFEDATGAVKPSPWKNYLATGCAWHDMLVHYFMHISSCCLRRALLPAGCAFRTDLTHAEDRDFLLRVLRGNKAVALRTSVLRIRLRAESASANSAAAIDGELRVMHEHLSDPSLPPAVRRRAMSALAFRCAVIAAFTGRQYGRALVWYFKAIIRDPLNINNFILPLRKCALVLRRASGLHSEDGSRRK
jgi:glycosyltransferase involved in cell wall biosynthesis